MKLSISGTNNRNLMSLEITEEKYFRDSKLLQTINGSNWTCYQAARIVKAHELFRKILTLYHFRYQLLIVLVSSCDRNYKLLTPEISDVEEPMARIVN